MKEMRPYEEPRFTEEEDVAIESTTSKSDGKKGAAEPSNRFSPPGHEEEEEYSVRLKQKVRIDKESRGKAEVEGGT